MDSFGSNDIKFTIVININIIIEFIKIKRSKNKRRLVRKYYINFTNLSLIKKLFVQFEYL